MNFDDEAFETLREMHATMREMAGLIKELSSEIQGLRSIEAVTTGLLWSEFPHLRTRFAEEIDRMLRSGSIRNPLAVAMLEEYARTARDESQTRPTGPRNHLTVVRDPPEDR